MVRIVTKERDCTFRVSPKTKSFSSACLQWRWIFCTLCIDVTLLTGMLCKIQGLPMILILRVNLEESEEEGCWRRKEEGSGVCDREGCLRSLWSFVCVYWCIDREWGVWRICICFFQFVFLYFLRVILKRLHFRYHLIPFHCEELFFLVSCEILSR